MLGNSSKNAIANASFTNANTNANLVTPRFENLLTSNRFFSEFKDFGRNGLAM